MKRAVAFLLVVMICLCCITAFAEEIDLSGMTEDQLRDLRSRIDAELSSRQAAKLLEGGVLLDGDIDECHVSLLSMDVMSDYKGDPALVLTILYTNNGDKAKPYMTAVSTKLFQNGVQLERAISVKDVDTQGQMAEVKPGASLELKIAYSIADISVPVEIEFGRYIDFSANPLKIIGTFSIE